MNDAGPLSEWGFTEGDDIDDENQRKGNTKSKDKSNGGKKRRSRTKSNTKV